MPVLPFDQNRNPLLDWSAHLFTAQRIQYVILTNTASLYSMVMPGRGMTSDKKFIQEVLSSMREFMTMDGNKFIFEKHIEPQQREVFFSKIVDRRVTGSMNDLVFQAKVYLIEVQLSPFEVSSRLNESPMSYLNYDRPKDELQKLVLRDGESPGIEHRENNVIYINAVRPPATKL